MNSIQQIITKSWVLASVDTIDVDTKVIHLITSANRKANIDFPQNTEDEERENMFDSLQIMM